MRAQHVRHCSNVLFYGACLLTFAFFLPAKRLAPERSLETTQPFQFKQTASKNDGRESAHDVRLESVQYSIGDRVVDVWPISFSAPEDIWVPVVPVKGRAFATIIPGNMATYTFEDETSYYEGYRFVFFSPER